MNKNQKIILIFVLILIFSFTSRFHIYASENTPLGYDTFTMVKLATSIQKEGYAPWVLNPLSLTGFFPLSYQSGGIYLLSEISLLTGLDLSETIFYWNFIFIAILGLLMLMTARFFFKDSYTPLLVSLIYINTRSIFYFSDWFYSVRNIFLILFLTSIFVLLTFKKKYKIPLLIFLILIMAITHRMIILVPLLFAAYFIAILIHNRLNSQKLAWGLFILTVLIFIVSVFFASEISLGSTVKTSVGIGLSSIDRLIDVVFRYIMSIGVLSLLIPIGYLLIVINKKQTLESFFILTFMLLFSAILKDQIYIQYLALPILTLIIGFAIEKFSFTKIKNYNLGISVTIIIILGLCIPEFVTVEDLSYEEYDYLTIVIPQTLNLKNWVKKNIDSSDSLVCNKAYVYCNQITALSNNEIRTQATSNDLIEPDRINFVIDDPQFKLKKIIKATENITQATYHEGIYEKFLIYYPNVHRVMINAILKKTNTNYLIDSSLNRSQQNELIIEKNYGLTNQIYNNGIQQIKPIDYNEVSQI